MQTVCVQDYLQVFYVKIEKHPSSLITWRVTKQHDLCITVIWSQSVAAQTDYHSTKTSGDIWHLPAPPENSTST